MSEFMRTSVFTAIDEIASQETGLRRQDLVDRFGFTILTASKYIQRYLAANPGSLEYSLSGKRYRKFSQ